MFESAELGHTLDKEAFDRESPALRAALREAQIELIQARSFAVVVVVGGVDGAGKGETVNLLNEWMDPRHIQTHALDDPTDEERERPPMWRFWRVLPPKGEIGIFLGSWHTEPILGRAAGKTTDAQLDQRMQQIARFEQMLAADGVLVLKLWLHLSKKRQKVRLKELESKKSTRWKVTPAEWRWFKRYDELRAVSERALRQTSTLEAPWTVVEGADPRYRAFTVAQTVLQALRERLDQREEVAPAPRVDPSPVVARPDRLDVLKALDLSQALDDTLYARELAAHQRRLALLTRERGFKKHSVILVFEGPDAAGKGGSIRRVTAALDARLYDTFPTAAPSEEERAQPYLWRFWRHIPRKARFAIFDRSWYGRVLVERVEGFAAPHDWARAYAEINEFEEQLVRDGTLLVKFWLQVSQQEQLARFKDRAAHAFKRYKLTEDDWRNRAKWDAYQVAACDMIDRTGTDLAPWTLVEADDKNLARIKVLQTVCARIEASGS